MMKPILAVGSIAFAVAIHPAVAQQQSPLPNPPATQQPDPTLVGLAVYSSDGQKIGQVAEVGLFGGAPAIRTEMGEFLGLGATSVVIRSDSFERKADRVEVSMTADEIKDTISKQQNNKQQ